MTVIHNKGFCFYCGDPTEEWEEIGNARIYWCGCRDGAKELRNMYDEMKEDTRNKAEKDGYERYSRW